MKISHYYGLTKPTTRSCLQISGIIFTGISTVIWGISMVNNSSGSVTDPIKVFVICFLSGNAFGLFITLLAFMEGFRQTKQTLQLYDSIPVEIREQYGLIKTSQPLNPKYNYLKIQVTTSKPEAPLLIFNRLANPDRIQIIIRNNLDDMDFHSLNLKIGRSYGQKQVHLTGLGLAKTIGWRKRQPLTSSEVGKSIEELIAVSQKENLDIVFFPSEET